MWPYYLHGARGVPHNRLRRAAKKQPFQITEIVAADDHQIRAPFLRKLADVPTSTSWVYLCGCVPTRLAERLGSGLQVLAHFFLQSFLDDRRGSERIRIEYIQ
jgi:hypothetical protein